MPGQPFAVEGLAELERVIRIVPQGDVLAEKWFTHLARKARALIENSGARKIVEEKSNEVENGGRFKNRRVMARFEFAGIAPSQPTLADWRFRQELRDRSRKCRRKWIWPTRMNVLRES